MFKSFDRTQEMMFPPSVQDFVPDNDLSVFVTEIVEALDITSLRQQYSRLGQNSYHPGMLLALLYYAYAQGVFSSRKIEERVCYDTRFMYVTGMQRPDFRTISDFRKKNLSLVKDYFRKITRLCMELGMAPLQSVSIDGTKVKASASRKHNRDHDQLTEQLAKIEAEIDQLLHQAEAVDQEEDEQAETPFEQQIEDRATLRKRLKEALSKLEASTQTVVNLTDPDCRCQKKIGPGYNAQVAVDRKHQLIVGEDVVADVNDSHQLQPMIEEMETTTQTHQQPKQINADAGYASINNYRYLEAHPHLDGFVPSREEVHRQSDKVSPFDKCFFTVDIEKRTGLCPIGKRMRFHRHARNKQGEPIMQFIGVECPVCPKRDACTKARFRTVSQRLDEPLIQQMQDKLQTARGKTAMRERRSVAEPAIGHLKEILGFRSFHLRGMPKVRGEFSLLCSAYNLKKLHKFLKERPIKAVNALTLPFLSTIRCVVRFFTMPNRFQRTIICCN